MELRRDSVYSVMRGSSILGRYFCFFFSFFVLPILAIFGDRLALMVNLMMRSFPGL